MEDAKLVCFRSEVLLQDWITYKAFALEEKSWIMNQIAEQKYLRLSSHLINSCITSDILKRVTTLIFDRAILEPTFCPMYAQLSCDICDRMPRFPSAERPMVKEITFKRVLLNTIQNVFEGTDELSDEIRKMNSPDQKEEQEDMERLDGSKSVESSLSLKSSKRINDMYFGRLESLLNHSQMCRRVRFLVRNIIDLRSNNWIPSGKESFFYPLKQQSVGLMNYEL